MKDACIKQCLCWSSKTIQADLDKKLQFQDIVQTSLRPDIVIQSTTTKHPNWLVELVELTVRWEKRCIWNEESQVHRPTHSVQRVWMAKLAVPSRSGVSGFSSMDHIELLRHSRKTTQSYSESTQTSCRKSIQVDTAKQRPRELEAIQWRVVIIWSLWLAALKVYWA